MQVNLRSTSSVSRHYATICDDRDTLNLMESTIRLAIKGALMQCAGLAANLELVGGDDVLKELKARFDENGAVSDLFSDAFADARNTLDGCEQWGPAI